MDEFGKRPLCPAPRGWIEFVREDAHGNRDGDAAFGIEKPEFAPILPVETGARKRHVIPPDAERMFAQRMNATTLSINSGHVAAVSHPDEIAQFILNATKGSTD
jgi:hypothetical protein